MSGSGSGLQYVSTRGKSPAVSFSDAALQGLAPDGGLYVPEPFPSLDVAAVRESAARNAERAGDSVTGVAELALRPFLKGDRLESQLSDIVAQALNFPIPLRDVPAMPRTAVLELFHGPTVAFKDVGARFLAECFSRLGSERTILVATSGDTGGAVASAFHKKPGIRVVILFPAGRVSERQERQLTCWGDNVHSLRVEGSFDDCQRLVKEAFNDARLRSQYQLTSANSINIGRLLPQMTYYAAASLAYERRHGRAPTFVIPTGNVGNAMGAIWARKLGFPVRRVVLATNANRVVPHYFATGEWAPKESLTTLANAMDVGNPSNMERVRGLYPELNALKEFASSLAVDDGTIREVISTSFFRDGEIWCPHTATGIYARTRLPADEDSIVVSTAHAAKFDTVVEPLIGQAVPVPASLAELLRRPSVVTDVPPTLEALEAQLR